MVISNMTSYPKIKHASRGVSDFTVYPSWVGICISTVRNPFLYAMYVHIEHTYVIAKPICACLRICSGLLYKVNMLYKAIVPMTIND